MVQETPVIVICGPTASGKTEAALGVAEALGAEIVSADSGQIYREMNIGTAKPSPTERSRVPFHLIDILYPDQTFSAAEFRRRALEAIAEIRKRGKRIIIAGGTGLYLKALEHGLFEGPASDPSLRTELEKRIEEEGVEALHQELQGVDPEAARTIPAANRQRLIRALEVHRLTGKPISEFWKEHEGRRGGERQGLTFVKCGLDPSKEALHLRIEKRVEEMVEQGLLAEVRGLWNKWGAQAPGLKLIGYKEIIAYLEEKSSLEAAIALLILNTRRYAKRQRTWFKKDREIQWFEDADTLTQCLTKK